MIASARDIQIVDSTLSVVGGDVVNNHNVHYHYERPKDIWAILGLVPNFRKIYLDALSKATPGTGMWLVKGKMFRLWLEDNGDIKIFWGSGIPGAGKTLLASIVIEHLETLSKETDTPICVCYVYFRYSDRAEVTVRDILEILVKQTLERQTDCQALIEQAYAQHLREGSEPTEAQLLGLLRQLAVRMKCTFYVLDALDEAPVKIQLSVVKALASLDVKLFITSRPLKTVEANFPDAHTFHIIAQDHDIELHITKVLNESADLQNLLGRTEPSLRDEVISTIKQNCGGMFLHAALQLDALSECLNAGDVRDTLEMFPSRIEDVYHKTWVRISNQIPKHCYTARAVLVWVLYASRPMTVEELERAVATSPADHKFKVDQLVSGTTLMSLCRGLVTVEEESHLVRLVHYTARNILEGLLCESFPHPHSLLATVCMTHLTERGFHNTTINSWWEFETALKRDPLLAYASEAWAIHARAGFDVEETKRHTAQFVKQSHAFPGFIGFGRTWHFDILGPLHMLGLFLLPLALIEGTSMGNPNTVTKIHRQSPLIVASWSGHKDLVARLVALPETEVNLVDAFGYSSLMRAAQAGHEGIVTFLLTCPGIQLNLVDQDGWSALMLAAREGYTHVVGFLVAHPRIHVNMVDNDGWSALMVAAREGHKGIVTLLLDHPEILINLADNNGWSALRYAVDNGHKGIVKLLLARPEIQFKLVDEDGWSALILAASQGHEGVVKLLLMHSQTPYQLVNIYGPMDGDGRHTVNLPLKDVLINLIVITGDVNLKIVEQDSGLMPDERMSVNLVANRGVVRLVNNYVNGIVGLANRGVVHLVDNHGSVHAVANHCVFNIINNRSSVHLPANHGIIRLVNNDGVVDLVKNHGEVHVIDNHSSVHLTANHGVIRLVNNDGVVHLVKNHGEVHVIDNHRSVHLTANHGIIRLVNNDGVVDLVKNHGRVELVKDNGPVSVVEDHGTICLDESGLAYLMMDRTVDNHGSFRLLKNYGRVELTGIDETTDPTGRWLDEDGTDSDTSGSYYDAEEGLDEGEA